MKALESKQELTVKTLELSHISISHIVEIGVFYISFVDMYEEITVPFNAYGFFISVDEVGSNSKFFLTVGDYEFLLASDDYEAVSGFLFLNPSVSHTAKSEA